MTGAMRRRLFSALLVAGCSDPAPECIPASPPVDDCSDPCYDARAPALVEDIPVADFAFTAPPADSRPIRVALFIGISPHPQSPENAWTPQTVIEQWKPILEGTSTVFGQCNMHLDIEAVQVIAVPARLLDFQGNEEGSFGGHPPAGTPNPDLFDYNQNERLTEDARELFGYGKQHSSKNAISIFTVENIVYYSNQMLSAAGGLSNPPNIYHHADDYPHRNSVLVVPERTACGGLPAATVAVGTVGQELGHMLLNTGGHVSAPFNLMNNGTRIDPDQCAAMETNLAGLFGDAEVPDPGPPPSL